MKSMKNIFFICSLITFFSCKRTNKETLLGPELKSPTASFLVLDSLEANYSNGFKEAKSDSISFQYIEKVPKKPVLDINGAPVFVEVEGKFVKDSTLPQINYFSRNTFFKAKFNEVVSWKLVLKKIDDYSISRVITGTSAFLDSSNSVWNGQGNSSIFAQGDYVLAELSFPNSSIILRDTLLILYGEIYNKNVATKLVDFEESLASAFTYSFTDANDPKPSREPFTTSIPSPPQGLKSILIYGNDFNGDYFVGGMNKQRLDIDVLSNYSPNDIYINMYIYGYSTPNSLGINTKATKLNIGISENDLFSNDDKTKSGQDSWVFDGKVEDTFEKQVSVDWVGWKLITIRYSELLRSSSKDNGGSGNGIFEPGKAYSVNCNLISSPNGNIVGANVDYIIITYGQPFDTNNL